MAFAFENTLVSNPNPFSTELVSEKTCVFISFIGEDSYLNLLTTDTTQYTTDTTEITTDQTQVQV